GETDVQVVTSLRGISLAPLDAVGEGLIINRTLYTRNGRKVDANKITQGDEIVVVVRGRASDARAQNLLVVDMLPAGFEIIKVFNSSDRRAFSFLPKLSRTVFRADRDDRLLAAIDVSRSRSSFAVAYLVQAVTAGRFIAPAPFVEDMYKPAILARGSETGVSISPAGSDDGVGTIDQDPAIDGSDEDPKP
ncbi:MAG: hypothetical protein AAGF15_11755, partial [Pseudomonadota bacterium]